MCLFLVRYREELKMFSHLTNWKAKANFMVGVLNFFDDPLIHSSSKKQLLPLCIPIRWWRCILHLPLSNLLWQWTFWEVLGATFDPSLENSWNLVGILRHSDAWKPNADKTETLLFSKLLYETLPKALRTRSLTALTSNFGCLSLVWFGRFGLQIFCTLHILHI